MALDIETPMAALFTRLQQAATPTGTSFQYATRRLEAWDDVEPPKRPALMLTSGKITLRQANIANVPLWLVTPRVVIYVTSADINTPPSIMLNELVASVVNLLTLQPGEMSGAGAPFLAAPLGQTATTLGGLVTFARVGGDIEIAEGLANDVAAASIPIEMQLSS